jgi:hypothetical protein
MDQQQYTTLLDVLKHLPDPRKRKGRRHRLPDALVLDCGRSGERTTHAARDCSLGPFPSRGVVCRAATISFSPAQRCDHTSPLNLLST